VSYIHEVIFTGYEVIEIPFSIIEYERDKAGLTCDNFREF
jgi:hypothetical protein